MTVDHAASGFAEPVFDGAGGLPRGDGRRWRGPARSWTLATSVVRAGAAVGRRRGVALDAARSRHAGLARRAARRRRRVAAWLRFHTGARDRRRSGRGRLCADRRSRQRCRRSTRFALGTPEYPDRSTTAHPAGRRASRRGRHASLAGPGIAGTARSRVARLPTDFAERLPPTARCFRAASTCSSSPTDDARRAAALDRASCEGVSDVCRGQGRRDARSRMPIGCSRMSGAAIRRCRSSRSSRSPSSSRLRSTGS